MPFWSISPRVSGAACAQCAAGWFTRGKSGGRIAECRANFSSVVSRRCPVIHSSVPPEGPGARARCRAKRHRDQQRAPGFRLCLAQQVAEAALPRPPLRQGARHAQLRRPTGGPAPGTHGGTFAADGGASLRSGFQFRVEAKIERASRFGDLFPDPPSGGFDFSSVG